MARQDFSDIAKGLLTLEINTVQKDGMSAQKMPGPSHALIDIVFDYWEFLCGRARDFSSPAPVDGRSEPHAEGDVPRLADWACPIAATLRHGRAPLRVAEGPTWPDKEPKARPVLKDFTAVAPSVASVATFDQLRDVAIWLANMRAGAEALASRPEGHAARAIIGGVRAEKQDDLLREVRSAVRAFRAEHQSVLHRIYRNSDQFKGILEARFEEGVGLARNAKRAEAAKLQAKNVVDDKASAKTPPAAEEAKAAEDGIPPALRIEAAGPATDDKFLNDDLVHIRKAWDIGTEIILMQTVIQLDGDVVTRFQTGTDIQSRAALHAIHSRGVDISLKYWGLMIDTIGRAAGAAATVLFRK